MKAFIEDWRGAWLSLLCGVAVVLAFSQAWQCPLFGYNNEQSTAAGAIIRVFYYPFYACGAYLAWKAGGRLLDATWRTGILLALLTLCAASVIWSIDPSGTLRRLVALFMTVLCAYAMAARFSWKRLSEVLAVAFGVMTIASLILCVAVPSMGRMTELFPGAWRGVWIEKNALGTYMAIGFTTFVAAAVENSSRRWLWSFMAAMAVGMVLMSTSKTALVCCMIGVAGASFVVLTRRGPILGIVLTWLAACAVLAMAGVAIAMPDKLFLLLGKDPTLTGRTFIWDGISRVMAARPLLGYGYGVVWTDEDLYAPLNKITHVAHFRAFHAHSAWYEVWLGMGKVGLIVWSCLFAELWLKGFYRTFRGTGGVFALPMIAIYGLSSLTESLALGYNDLHWFLAAMLLVKLSLPDDIDAFDNADVPVAEEQPRIRLVRSAA